MCLKGLLVVASLPYRNKEQQKKAMRKIMRNVRAEQKALKASLRRDRQAMEQLRKIPLAHQLIFGKKASRRTQNKPKQKKPKQPRRKKS